MRRIPNLYDAEAAPANRVRRPDFATLGAAGGPQSVGWAALRHGAQMLMDSGLQDKAEATAKAAALVGQADGAAAFQAGQAPVLRADDTIAGQARDKAMMSAYLVVKSQEVAHSV